MQRGLSCGYNTQMYKHFDILTYITLNIILMEYAMFNFPLDVIRI